MGPLKTSTYKVLFCKCFFICKQIKDSNMLFTAVPFVYIFSFFGRFEERLPQYQSDKVSQENFKRTDLPGELQLAPLFAFSSFPLIVPGLTWQQASKKFVSLLVFLAFWLLLEIAQPPLLPVISFIPVIPPAQKIKYYNKAKPYNINNAQWKAISF